MKVKHYTRDFLNLPGFHGDGSIICKVLTEQDRNMFHATLSIRDCRNVSHIALVDLEKDYENNLYKLDLMIDRLKQLRDVIEEVQNKKLEG